MATIAESQALHAVPEIAKSLFEMRKTLNVIAKELHMLNKVLCAAHDLDIDEV